MVNSRNWRVCVEFCVEVSSAHRTRDGTCATNATSGVLLDK